MATVQLRIEIEKEKEVRAAAALILAGRYVRSVRTGQVAVRTT
jgi:hypothetical protein